jgi:Mrp family chromosome partitioning ATPase
MLRRSTLLESRWFHRRFSLTQDGRYVTTTELAEWARGPYDQLHKNLLLHTAGNGDRPRLILLAPARHGDGTTTTATLLASSLANTHRCLLVDLNFRWPGVADALGLVGASGIASLLPAPLRADVDQAIVPTRIPNLFALPGPQSVGQRTLPELGALRTLLAELRTRFDYVVADAAPLLDYPDTALLAPLADVTLLVIAADATPVELCLAARAELERARACVAGVILTRQRCFVPAALARRLLGDGAA